MPGRLHLLLVMLLAGASLPRAAAEPGDEEDAEKAVAQLMHPLEKAGFDFRADVWERDLKPDMGKAVRVQLFKGNDYRVCIAVAKNSGVKIEAHVLAINGQPIEDKNDNRGTSIVLSVKPPRTGVYVVAINQAPSGKQKTVTCAMIMGYK
jgi:hypothetical protein